MFPGSDAGTGGMKHKEMRTLLIMGFAALVVLVLLLSFLFSGAGGSGKEAADADGEEGDTPPEDRRISTSFVDGQGIPMQKLQVEKVPDPGDEAEEGDLKNEIKPFEPNPHWADDVIDGEEYMDPEAFYYLVHRAATLTEEEFEKTVDKKIESPDLMRAPRDHRGRRIRIRGTLIALREKPLEENRSGVRRAYIGQMVDRYGEVLSFYIIDLPPASADWTPFETVIQVRGIFYKIWKYRNRENRAIESPLVIGRTVKQIPKYPHRKPIKIFGVELVVAGRNITWAEIIVGIVVVLFIPVMFFLVRNERRKYEAFKAEQTGKRKAHRKPLAKKPGAAGGKEAPEAGPASPEAPAGDTAPPGDAGTSPEERPEGGGASPEPEPESDAGGEDAPSGSP